MLLTIPAYMARTTHQEHSEEPESLAKYGIQQYFVAASALPVTQPLGNVGMYLIWYDMAQNDINLHFPHS